jgi:hypothetical protein
MKRARRGIRWDRLLLVVGAVLLLGMAGAVGYACWQVDHEQKVAAAKSAAADAAIPEIDNAGIERSKKLAGKPRPTVHLDLRPDVMTLDGKRLSGKKLAAARVLAVDVDGLGDLVKGGKTLAQTAVTMDAAITATLKLNGVSNTSTTGYDAPMGSISIATLGASANMTLVFSPLTIYIGTPVGPDPYPPDPMHYWQGMYWRYDLSVTAGSSTQTTSVYVWFADGWEAGGTPIPSGGTKIYNGTITADFSASVHNVILDSVVTEASPTDRGFIGPFDRTLADRWIATGTTTVSASLYGMSVGPVAFTPPLNGDGSVNVLGPAFGASLGIVSRRPTGNGVTYASFEDLQWFGSKSAAMPSLFNPGTGRCPDTTNNPLWKRTAPATGGYDEIGGAAGELYFMSHNGGLNFASYSRTVWPNFDIKYTPLG